MTSQVFQNFKEEAELFFVKKMIVGEKLKEVYSDCLDIIFDVTKTKDSTRGVFAFNPQYGQGKSFFFDVVNPRHRRIKGKFAFKRTTARELCEIYTSAKNGEDPKDALKRFINVRELFIDDVGDELKDGKERSHYANKLNVLRYVLLKRYDLWNEKGWRTFATTNLTIEQIGENYDGRVADRVVQMCYFKEFKFLKKGSFRQMDDSRKLSQKEISESWAKFIKPKRVEKVNLEKYFNELLSESETYLNEMNLSFWSFTRSYLEKKGLLTASDYNSINEEHLDAVESTIRKETRDSVRQGLRHAGGQIVRNEISKAVKNIKRSDVFDGAKNLVAKRKFIELKKQGFVFV